MRFRFARVACCRPKLGGAKLLCGTLSLLALGWLLSRKQPVLPPPPLVPLVVVSEAPPAAAALQCDSGPDVGRSCVNVYRCGGANRPTLSLYVYPHRRYQLARNTSADGGGGGGGAELSGWSREFAGLQHALVHSEHYSTRASSACLLAPSVDTLANSPRSQLVRSALHSLPHWNGGRNHVVFSASCVSAARDTDGAAPLGAAMLVSSCHSRRTFRLALDVAAPCLRGCHDRPPTGNSRRDIDQRRWLVAIFVEHWSAGSGSQPFESQWAGGVLTLLLNHTDRTLCHVDGSCHQHILTNVRYCVMAGGWGSCPPWLLMSAARAGCVPVVSPSCGALYPPLLPFSTVLDWRLVSVLLAAPLPLSQQLPIIAAISAERERQLRAQLVSIYSRYFSTCRQVALAALAIIGDRLLPHRARSYHTWNGPAADGQSGEYVSVPYTAPARAGCTALLSGSASSSSSGLLLRLVRQLSTHQFVSRIVVVWSSSQHQPPSRSSLERYGKSVRVIARPCSASGDGGCLFHQLSDIDTECVLSVFSDGSDPDLSSSNNSSSGGSQLEFSYQVWREFPDRVVNLVPSRQSTPSELFSAASASSPVLPATWQPSSGDLWPRVAPIASLYHKQWHYHYVARAMPAAVPPISSLCDDISINLLVTNTTGQPPINVALDGAVRKCGVGANSTHCPLPTAVPYNSSHHSVARSHCLHHLPVYHSAGWRWHSGRYLSAEPLASPPEGTV